MPRHLYGRDNTRQQSAKIAHKPAADCLNMGDKTHMPTIEKGKP
jgi:hypothetical protein